MIASDVVFNKTGGALSRRLPEDQTRAQPGALSPDYGFILPGSSPNAKEANLSQFFGH